jgi:hypothetical protein
VWTDQEKFHWIHFRAFTSFYQSLFTSSGAVADDECITSVQARVLPIMNDMLTEAFSLEEVDQALAQMHPLKSPGPDGFGVCFYQKHWAVVGDVVRKSVLDFLDYEIFYPGINQTFITLVPKIPATSSVSNYKPIGLCNVFV